MVVRTYRDGNMFENHRWQDPYLTHRGLFKPGPDFPISDVPLGTRMDAAVDSFCEGLEASLRSVTLVIVGRRTVGELVSTTYAGMLKEPLRQFLK